MAIIVDRYISDDGEVLLPLESTLNNTSDLLSDRGRFFKVFTHSDEAVAIEAGNPMGLLLTLTYPATP